MQAELLMPQRDPFECARTGDTSAIPTFPDLNIRDRVGKTLLHEACSHGQLEFACQLLEAGARPSPHKTNGFTPLLYAAAKGHGRLVTLLLTHGAQPLEADQRGETAFHLAARSGSLQVLSALMEPSGDLTFQEAVNVRTSNGRTPMHSAARNGHLEAVHWLLGHGGDTWIADSSGILPIHEAARQGQVAVLDLLLKCKSESSRGATLNAQDCAKCTPLHHACAGGHLQSVRKLLEAGAEVDTREASGGTPLYWAATKGHPDVMALLIHGFRADPNTSNCYRSALHSAAAWGHVPAVKMLLEAGAEHEVRDSEGRTVLELVKTLPTVKQCPEVVSLLES